MQRKTTARPRKKPAYEPIIIGSTDPIPPRKRGAPPRLAIDYGQVEKLLDRGASIRQVRDTMRMSHGTAQRAIDEVIERTGKKYRRRKK